MVKVQDEEMATEPANTNIKQNRAYHSNQHQNGKPNVHYHHGSTPTIRFPPGFEPQGRYAQANNIQSLSGSGSVSPEAAATPQHVVDFHVYPGVTITLQMGDSVQVYKGPVTVPMVSTNSSPPIPMPVQVPPGHMIQQVVDESGALRHVILSANPHPILPMQTHYGPAPGNGGNGPPQPFFAPGAMPPYPGPHFGAFGPSPPPPHFHKDERSQRQYIKLKKKLEQKLQRPEPSPPFSPRKDLQNGTSKSTKDPTTPSTSEDGDTDADCCSTVADADLQDHDDAEGEDVEGEDGDLISETAAIVEFLSSVKEPVVAELTARSALLTWPALTDAGELAVADIDVVYEVLLADTAKGGNKYRSIYLGASLSCRIEDLRPGSKYSLCLKAHHVHGLQGVASPPVDFTTPPCPPDAPLPPKLLARTRFSLQLRWNAPADNGAPITQYVLECDDGSGEWREVTKNRAKQFCMIRLEAGKAYAFRVAAINECGRSPYSDAVTYATCGNPPAPPAPPSLLEAGITTLRLAWQRRPTDDEFTLQMDDNRSGHGFLPVFTGQETECRLDKLTRHSDYRFRLRAGNEEGSSRWSEEVTYRTLPAAPAPPTRPTPKGKIHATFFRVRWEPPHDRGGSDITHYILELNQGSGYSVVYEGPETDYLCDRLKPGTCHQARVSCCGPGGRSPPSEAALITTEAVCPGPCAPPRACGRPRPHSLSLRFSYPEYDGGAPITSLEIEMTAPDASKRVVYTGTETECTVTDLAPGQPYLFHLRAHNRVGHGPWSEGVEVLSGAAAPDAPQPPLVVCRTAHAATVTWSAPAHNGAPITAYRVEMASLVDGGKVEFVNVPHTGVATCCDVKGLIGNQEYLFRILAVNAAGFSRWSDSTAIRTPPSPPSQPPPPHLTAHPTSLTVHWTAPSSNGSPLSHYNIDYIPGCTITHPASLPCMTTLENLQPETAYRVRVQAVNAVGAGPYSVGVKGVTGRLPPSPPRLEGVGLGWNFVRLRWDGGKGGETFVVEMTRSRSHEFHTIYQGNGTSHKVTRLLENTSYLFRISASNESGQGEWSEPLELRTALAPPSPPKGLKVTQVSSNSCTVEWLSARPPTTPNAPADPIIWRGCLSRVRIQDYKEVYRGDEPRMHLTHLEPNAEYSVRVCAVRVTADSSELAGPFATAITFATPAVLSGNNASGASVSGENGLEGRLDALQRGGSGSSETVDGKIADKQFTDQQWAIIILSIFSLFAVLVAVGMQHLIDWGAHH